MKIPHEELNSITNEEIFPILVIPAFPEDSGEISFLGLKDKITIGTEYASVIWKIIRRANGFNSLRSISELENIDYGLTEELFRNLNELHIMEDSRSQYKHFHEISASPDVFVRTMSQEAIRKYCTDELKRCKEGEIVSFDILTDSNITESIIRRHSCRSFSSVKKLSRNIVGNICYNAYYISDKVHSSPSGGALYPLKLFVLVEQPQNGLETGYYEYDSKKNVLIRFKHDVDIEMLKYCFNDERLPFNSTVQIIVAANLERQTYKYSNKGYRLTLIEVGHVAQNILLYCTEQGVGCCELGGVLERPMIQELELAQNHLYPMVAIAIGYPANESIQNSFVVKEQFEREFVGERKALLKCGINYIGDDATFVSAYSEHRNSTQLAGATSRSYTGAIIKAITEGYERFQSSQIRADYYTSAEQIESSLHANWLSPNAIKPISEWQAKRYNLVKFNDRMMIHWTNGYFLNTGKPILVPSDLIYYGCTANDGICRNDSSGIAAHPIKAVAIDSAILELIERDAIMRSWILKLVPAKYPEYLLPIHAKKQIEYWKSHGRTVHIVDMKSKFAPTIQVFIVGNEYPYFVSGAAATFDDVDGAINKALMEAENTLFSLLVSPDTKETSIEKVLSPADHGRFYANEDNSRYLSWMWEPGNEQVHELDLPNRETVLEHINPIIVDISDDNGSLSVVRAFSYECVPISFGYHMEYINHPVFIREYSLTMDKLSFDEQPPHYFA